jgi:hydroxyacylglutathione hydrolase
VKAVDRVITIPALGDNFIYLYLYDQHNVLVIDPGQSSSVLRILKKRGLSLATVLVTHHHWDHVAGIDELKNETDCEVLGADRKIPRVDRVVVDGQILEFGSARIQVIGTSGHTRTAVCYYLRPSAENTNGILWTGDTLFVGGCGRLLECDARTMWDSLAKLAGLPNNTRLYCGHDYTVENYEFALSIEPDNQAIRHRLHEVRHVQEAGRPTVPSTILQEKMTNPFLRAAAPELKAALNMREAGPVEVFAELRRRKDLF